MKRLALLMKHIKSPKRWANLQKGMKLEKLAHFQSKLTFLVKQSPGSQ